MHFDADWLCSSMSLNNALPSDQPRIFSSSGKEIASSALRICIA